MAGFRSTLPALGGHRSVRRALAVAMVGATITLGAGIGASPAGAVASSGSGCAAVNIIAARATGEAPGAGIIGALVTLVQNASKQTVSTASVNYPAALLTYANSTAQGDSALKSQLTSQEQSCPNQKQVLVGYSQGAQLVGDVLGGGGGGVLGATSAPVSSGGGGQGRGRDPDGRSPAPAEPVLQRRHRFGRDRPVPAGANQSLAPFAAKIQSYCDTGDPFCAGGANLGVHLNYTNKYDNAAESFILGKIGG